MSSLISFFLLNIFVSMLFIPSDGQPPELDVEAAKEIYDHVLIVLNFVDL